MGSTGSLIVALLGTPDRVTQVLQQGAEWWQFSLLGRQKGTCPGRATGHLGLHRLLGLNW